MKVRNNILGYVNSIMYLFMSIINIHYDVEMDFIVYPRQKF